MKLQYLKLRGFKGIQKGLGMDEIEIDLSKLSGLTALFGVTGAGKTTVLENMLPYRIMPSHYPSKTGIDKFGRSNLKGQIYLRDSEKENVFTYGGDTFRTRIKLDAHGGGQEGFIWVNDHPKVDGKVSNYDAFLNEALGLPLLVYSSIFASQSGRKMSDMTSGQMLELFSELLRLYVLDKHTDTVKRCSNAISGSMENLKRDIQQKEFELAKRVGLQASLNIMEASKADKEKAIGESGKLKAAASDNIKVLKEKKVKIEGDKKRIEDLQKTLKLWVKEIDTEKTAGEDRLKILRKKLSGILEGIKKNDVILKNENEIRKAAEAVESIKLDLDKSEKDIENSRASIRVDEDKLSKSNMDLLEIQAGIKSLNDANEKPLLEQNINTLKSQLSALDLRDKNLLCPNCGTRFECPSDDCSFIKSARDAGKQLPGLEKKLDEVVKKYRRDMQAAQIKESKAKDIISKLNKVLESKKAMCTELEKKRDEHKKKYKDASDLASDISGVEIAASRKTDLNKQREDVTAEGTGISDRMKKSITEKTLKKTEAESEIETLNKSIDDEIDTKIDQAEVVMQKVESGIKTLEDDLLKIKVEVSTARRDLTELDAVEADLKAKQAERDIFSQNLRDWTFLHQACPAIKVLEIDGAAPVISDFANRLIERTDGPPTIVKLNTQDENGKDNLSITIIDKDGETVDLDDRSGGEETRELKSLRLGMTLLAKEKGGKEYETAFADEEDKGLDVQSAIQFISMYPAFMDLGRFKDFYFISHVPACVAMADHIIDFGKHGITIE